jgi:prenyltransferase beta subunit
MTGTLEKAVEISSLSDLPSQENDMRFVYCAAAVCALLNDFGGMDVDLAVRFILSSQRYDGGLSQVLCSLLSLL